MFRTKRAIMPMCRPFRPPSESRLMNYEEWLLEAYEIVPFGQEVLAGIMNRFLHSQVYENGIVEEAVEYPREWPSAWLDGVIPPYTGTGWMYDLYAAHPVMSYAPKDLVHVAVTVYDYAPEDVAAYIGMLLAEGLEETHDERYAADWIEQVRSFRGSDFTLNIVFANGESPVMTTLDADELQPMVQFNVDFDREPYEPDMGPTPDTALLNMEAYDIMTGETPGRELDIIVTSETDEYGRLNEMVANPSKWPKEILGEFIPEFTLPAVLLRTMLTAPADAPAPEETLIYSIGLVAFMPEVPDAYAQELIAFGYRGVPPEEYDEDTTVQAQEYSMYRLFTLPGVRLYLCVDEFNGAEELMLSLYFDGRLNAFWNQ